MKPSNAQPMDLSDRDPFRENLTRLKSAILLVLCVLCVLVSGLFFFAGPHLEFIARGIYLLFMARIFQAAYFK